MPSIQADLYLVDMYQPHTEGERGYLEDTYNLQGILTHLFHLIAILQGFGYYHHPSGQTLDTKKLLSLLINLKVRH